MTETERRGFVGPIAFLIYLALFFTALAPFDYEFPLTGIEGGWLAASVYAGLHRFAYGTQFVFTNGPLFPLYHREFAGDLSIAYSLARLAIVVFLALAFTQLTEGSRRASIGLAFLILVLFWPWCTWYANDGILVVVPLVVTLLLLADRGPHWLIVLGVVLSAAIGIAKVSLITFTIGAFLLADIAQLSRRRPPLFLIGLGLSAFVLFAMSGQKISDFVSFWIGSAEMTAGYTAALAVDGLWWEFGLFLLASALILFALAGTEVRAVRRRAERPVIAAMRLLLAAGLALFSLKAGFVRHDGHSLAAWVAMAFLTALLALPATIPAWRPARAAVYLAVPVALITALFLYAGFAPWLMRDLTTTSPRVLGTQLAAAVDLARNPTAWQAGNEAKAAAADAAVREWLPLQALEGKVDALSNIQSAVIAAGLNYWPHPTIQENMAYSPRLIARDRAFFAGPDAPDTVIFAPGDATDGRHPASIEGSLWPLLMSRYAVSSEASGQLILSRRVDALPVAETPLLSQDVAFGQAVALPASGVLFLQAQIHQTLAGRLAEAAFKGPRVRIELKDAGGKTKLYRLVPGMISEGMVIAPTVDTTEAYRTIASGNDPAALPRPVAFRILTDGPWAYEPTIAISVTTLVVPPG